MTIHAKQTNTKDLLANKKEERKKMKEGNRESKIKQTNKQTNKQINMLEITKERRDEETY